MSVLNDVAAGVNFHPFLASALRERTLLALAVVTVIWKKCTPLYYSSNWLQSCSRISGGKRNV